MLNIYLNFNKGFVLPDGQVEDWVSVFLETYVLMTTSDKETTIGSELLYLTFRKQLRDLHYEGKINIYEDVKIHYGEVGSIVKLDKYGTPQIYNRKSIWCDLQKDLLLPSDEIDDSEGIVY